MMRPLKYRSDCSNGVLFVRLDGGDEATYDDRASETANVGVRGTAPAA
jgi:hypothetical protein